MLLLTANSSRMTRLDCCDLIRIICSQMGVSKNRGTPKSSILIGFSIINHPFWGENPLFLVQHPNDHGFKIFIGRFRLLNSGNHGTIPGNHGTIPGNHGTIPCHSQTFTTDFGQIITFGSCFSIFSSTQNLKPEVFGIL